jgi:hypothetical protein
VEPHPYWRAFLDRDLDRLETMFAPEIVFHSPIISHPGFEGPQAVAALETILFELVTDAQLLHALGDQTAHALVLSARFGGTPGMVTLLLELNPDGKIREIWAMARPLTASTAIARGVGTALAEHQKPGRGRWLRPPMKALQGMAAQTDRLGGRLIGALNRSTGR